LNYSGSHVRIFLNREGNVTTGNYFCIESSLAEDRVHFANYTYSQLVNNYIPYNYYNRLNYDLVYSDFDIPQEEIYAGGYLTVLVDIENQGSQSVTSSFIASVYDLNDNFFF